MKSAVNLSHPTCLDPRWNALVTRDASLTGPFFYAVRTTGVYCLPACSARTPRPENVSFFDTRESAEAAGHRPCKRCKPRGPAAADTDLVTRICRYIEAADAPPTLPQLSLAFGPSEHQIHRKFKAIVGVTPKQYARMTRRKKAAVALHKTAHITEAIYQGGFNSSGRFYEEATQIFGTTPSMRKRGGEGLTVYFAVGQCSLGAILVALTEKGVGAIALGDDPEILVQELQDEFSKAELLGGVPDFERTIARVIHAIDTGSSQDLPLDIQGTSFQQRVWQALRQIPPGETRTYSEIAQALDMPTGARAVARACASNRHAVAIPCHRVVRTDGSLTGYRWGIERKRALLEREKESSGDTGLPPQSAGRRSPS